MADPVTKTINGEDYPSSAFLVVEDPQWPDTWHLQIKDKAGKLDHRLMGAAWAALHGGYRGNTYEGPKKQDAIAQLKKYYESENIPVPNTNAVSVVTANLVAQTYREETQHNKKFLVVPGVPLREGVMNDYFVPAEEIEHAAQSWNGTPITIHHPKLNNGSVNVPNPDVAIIGKFYNAQWHPDQKYMSGEYWIDLQEAEKYQEGQQILSAIRANQILETSTGYYADDEPTTGMFDGRVYNKIHRNLQNDHIAILTHETGACSVQDGCGVNRNAAQCATSCPFRNAGIPKYQKDHLPRQMLEGFTFNKGNRTPEQLDALRAHIQEKGIDKPVLVVRQGDGGIKILDGNHRVAMAKDFNIDQIPVKTVDENLQPVDPEMMYAEWAHHQDQGYLNRANRSSTSNEKQLKEKHMKLTELVPWLLGKGIVKQNADGEYEVDEQAAADPAAADPNADPADALSAEDIASLKGLIAWFQKSGGADAMMKQQETVQANLANLQTVSQFAQDMQAKEKREREALVAAIKASPTNIYSDEELGSLGLPVLVKLNAQMNVNYAGFGAGQLVVNEADAPLGLRSILLAEKEN